MRGNARTKRERRRERERKRMRKKKNAREGDIMVESAGEIPREERKRAGWSKEEKMTNSVCIFSGSLYSVIYIDRVFNLCQSESSKKVLIF